MIELLVASTILLVGVALMLSLLWPSVSLFRKQSGMSDSYRTCLLMVNRFRQSMLNSQLETVTIATDKQAISWQKMQDDPPFAGTTGAPIMEDTFFVLFLHDKKIFLKEVPGSGGAASTTPSRLPLAALAEHRESLADTRTLARDVTAFQVTDGDDNLPLLDAPLRLSITCTVSTYGRASHDSEDFSMSCSVTPRSQRW
jgi:hypothetical protein